MLPATTRRKRLLLPLQPAVFPEKSEWEPHPSEGKIDDILPEDQADRDEGTQMQTDVKEDLGLLEAEYVLTKNQVSRAADGKEFGYALNYSQQ